MTTFVLVPGFWLGAWAWDAVVAGLRESGHDALALTPLGVGEREAHTGVSTEDQVDDVVARLREQDEPVVLVGHSGAGPVVVAAAERARDEVSALVLVDTGPLPGDVSHLDFVGPERAAHVRRVLADNAGRYPMPSREELGPITAGIDETTFAAVHARSAPVPEGVPCTTARRAERGDPTLPKIVVACIFTAADVREGAAAGAPGFAEMTGPEWSIVELPTGHWPMFSEPRALTDVLVKAGRAGPTAGR
ncbi:alpha/beta fold hydrolase [Pseudonocardia endophytica]|uniref:Pimeloyl-ACP methyl ester carboxylesterase n=1 Tax=Pseudonocardia endophytica TaxID=401976 RepID=A0A4R1HY61_PSEEN|nr:alpha/beta fold hydrolase [Pseudonocardia endophytica]TCK27727.1 pimeloyl-ACP methyl ester carboxylesterase [Pseudonocardia endophytica]